MSQLQPIYVTCLGFASLFIFLVALLAGLRTGLVASGRREAASFAPDGVDVSPFSARLARAHANCVENLGLFAVLVFVAYAMGRIEQLNSLAYPFLMARLAQSTIHLVSISNLAVTCRAVCFFCQLLIQAYWIVNLLFAV